MRIRYSAGPDILLSEFRDALVAGTRDLDENTLLDRDAYGNIRTVTIEHVSERSDVPRFSYEQAAP